MAISIFSLPHSDNQFFLASRQELISFRLHGDSRHTALSIFSSPHGDNRFFFAPRKNLLITHQGILWEAFFLSLCILSDALNQGFNSLALVLLFLRRRVMNSLCVLYDAHSPGWWATLWPRTIRLKFRWYHNLGGTPLELVHMDIHNRPTELTLSKSF